MNVYWARGVLIALIVVSCTLKATSQPWSDDLLTPASRTLTNAGYRVVRKADANWQRGKLRGATYLEAWHPGCRVPLTVRVVPLYDRSPSRIDMYIQSTSYFVFDTWQGPYPSSGEGLLRYMELQVKVASSFGERPNFSPKMLSVTDPPGCSALHLVQWEGIWRS